MCRLVLAHPRSDRGPGGLAGVGPDRTHVRIFAAPGQPVTQHRIEVVGEFGRLTVGIRNVPSDSIPRTGLLPIFSTIAFPEDYARICAPGRASGSGN